MKLKDNLIFHTDPAHGWLEVPLRDLKALDILDQITPYSYMDRKNAYLEEDQDAGTYLKAREAQGAGEATIKSEYTEKSPVRNRAPYRAPDKAPTTPPPFPKAPSQKAPALLVRHFIRIITPENTERLIRTKGQKITQQVREEARILAAALDGRGPAEAICYRYKGAYSETYRPGEETSP